MVVILLFQNGISKGRCLPGAEHVACGVSLREMLPKHLHQSKSGPVVSGVLLLKNASVKRAKTCNV